MNTHDTLLHVVTAYDRRQSKRPGYNIYALPQYIQRVDEIMADIASGRDVRSAVIAGFNGRLVDACLRALQLPITSLEEVRGGSYIYTQANSTR